MEHVMRSRPLKDRFSEKYRVDPATQCWVWTASVMTGGYGMINGGKGTGNIGAHRASWIVHFGPIPAGMNVLHRCDNPSCVNPEHLFLGGHLDNMKDMVIKGRSKGLQRSDQIEKMLTLLEAGVTQDMVAKVFGVHRTTIQRTLDRMDVARQASPSGYVRPAGGIRYLTVDERQEIRKLLADKKPVAQIARQFRVSRVTIRRTRIAA